MGGPWSTLAALDGSAPANGEPISTLLGPIVIGVLVNSFVYGIVTLHWIQYTLGLAHDSLKLRLLVNWCFLADTVHTAAALWVLWVYGVDNYANLSYLTATLWPLTATPLFVSMVSMPIQILFAWRIREFTHSLWLFFVLLAFAVTSGTLGIITAIKSLLHNDITAAHGQIPFIGAWLSASMMCDVLLAALLFAHLWKSKTGFRSTDTVIGRLMRSAVETTTLSAVFCICYLALFSALPRTNFHIIFSLPLGRVYTTTLLSTLNSRTTLREEIFGINALSGDPLSDAFHITEQMRRMGTQVAIAVEQQVKSDNCEEVNLRELRRGRPKDGHEQEMDLDLKHHSSDMEFAPM